MRPSTALLSIALLALAAAAGAQPAPTVVLQPLGEATLPAGLEFMGTRVGGLSGITYDPVDDLFWAISDDPAERGPARVYRLRIALADGRLSPGDVTVQGVVPLVDRKGRLFERLSIDGEGIARTVEGNLWIASEGIRDRRVAPFVAVFGPSGRHLRELALPGRYLRRGRDEGVRQNLGFESLTLSPDAATLYTGLENALEQDGPAADVGRPSLARILEIDVASGEVEAEYIYSVEPVAARPAPGETFRVSGLVELLALAPRRLLALERSYSAGVGHRVRLFEVPLAGASNVRRWSRLTPERLRRATALAKIPLLDLEEPAVATGNLEGLSFGPRLADGRRTLVLVGDDNFDPTEPTRFLAFALGAPRGDS